MKTFRRICIKDHTVTDGAEYFTVHRGQEYLTSVEKDGCVTVLSTYWARMPVDIFAGEIPGPGETH